MQSSDVSAGQTADHNQYNNLRADVIEALAKTLKDFTADWDMSAGQPVGISWGSNNKIAKAFTPYVDKTLNDTLNAQLSKTCSLGTDKFLIVYPTAASTLKAVVGTIARNTRVITWGSTVTITTDLKSGTNIQSFALAQLATDKFAIAYNSQADATIGKIVACTVSGTTITVGTPATFYDHATANFGAIGMAKINTDKVQIVCDFNNADAKGIAVTFSGTTPTAGTSIAMDANIYSTTNGIWVVSPTTDKFVAWSANGYLQCGTVSGTTITLGAAVDGVLTLSFTNSDFIVHDTDKFLIKNGGNVRVCTIATRTITVNGSQTVAAGLMYLVSPTLFYIHDTSLITKCVISGSTVTATTVGRGWGFTFERTSTDGGYGSTGAYIDLGSGNYMYCKITSTTNLRVWQFGNANNFVGILQANITQGNSVSVMLKGIDSHQSGLLPGVYYNVTLGGTLDTVAAASALDTPIELALLLAVSDTEVKV